MQIPIEEIYRILKIEKLFPNFNYYLFCTTLKCWWQKLICGLFFTNETSEKICISIFLVKNSVQNIIFFFTNIWENKRCSSSFSSSWRKKFYWVLKVIYCWIIITDCCLPIYELFKKIINAHSFIIIGVKSSCFHCGYFQFKKI